jgi:cytochrome P450
MTENYADAPVCNIDFYSDETIANPVSAYHAMLKAGPVVWLQPNRMYAICGHAALVASLRNHQVFSSASGVSVDDSINKLLIGSSLNSDPPQHDESRAITFPPVSPKQLYRVKDRIESEARYIVEKLVQQKTFDAATELAPYLPLTIVRDLVGLGTHGKENMLKWGAATFELMGWPGERRESAINNLKELRAFLEDPQTLDNLSEDGWARRATRLGIESGMDPKRAAELMRDYIPPSLDTTISAIGYAIMLFATHPQQWQKLRDNPDLTRNAIEEVVRLNTPIRAFTRRVAEDTEVAGCQLRQGSRVLMVFGAANRDPARFANPDAFDIERKTIGHVGFGQGVHACLGMNLARLEISSLLHELVTRVERFTLTGDVVPGINSSIHSLASVPVEVTPSA